MVSEWKKRKSFDIISKQKKQYQRKDFLMKPIISQNLLNVLKNKIIPIISLKLFNDVEFLLNKIYLLLMAQITILTLFIKFKPLLETLLNLLLPQHLKS